MSNFDSFSFYNTEAISQQILRKRRGLSRALLEVVDKLDDGLGKNKKQNISQSLDLIFVFSALAFAHLLRLETADFEQLWAAYILVPLLTVAIFSHLGVYNMVVRHSGMGDLAPVVKGVVLSSFVTLITLYLLAPDPNPRSIFIIYGLVLLVFSAGARHLWRGLRQTQPVPLANR